MSQLNIEKIEINDLFHELINENKRLLNELLFAQKCIKLLEKYRNNLNNICINCKCDQNFENKLNFNDLEIEYKSVFDNKLKLEINEEINNQFINSFNNNNNNSNKDNELIDTNSDKKPKINCKKKKIINNKYSEEKTILKSDKSDQSYDQNEHYVNYRLNENKKTTKRCETLIEKKTLI
jgi:hypothetical protein